MYTQLHANVYALYIFLFIDDPSPFLLLVNLIVQQCAFFFKNLHGALLQHRTGETARKKLEKWRNSTRGTWKKAKTKERPDSEGVEEPITKEACRPQEGTYQTAKSKRATKPRPEKEAKTCEKGTKKTVSRRRRELEKKRMKEPAEKEARTQGRAHE